MPFILQFRELLLLLYISSRSPVISLHGLLHKSLFPNLVHCVMLCTSARPARQIPLLTYTVHRTGDIRSRCKEECSHDRVTEHLLDWFCAYTLKHNRILVSLTSCSCLIRCSIPPFHSNPDRGRGQEGKCM